ncbi:MAG: MFS transporter [Spirochaetaceae bacterium]|jgi:PPP family 3-phenylpropionic acid transporter|nr:MFS transporter [Spirochaetaceae bacterium]
MYMQTTPAKKGYRQNAPRLIFYLQWGLMLRHLRRVGSCRAKPVFPVDFYANERYIFNNVYWTLAFIGVFLVPGVLSPYISVLIRGYGFSHSILGIILGFCEAAAIASPFVMGFFADRYRCYKPVLLVSLITGTVCGAILLVSKNLTLCAAVLPFLSFGYRAVQPLMDAISTIKLGKDGNYGKYRAIGSLAFFTVVVFLQFTPFILPNTSRNIAFWIAFNSMVSVILITVIPSRCFINDRVSSRECPPPATERRSPAAPVPGTKTRAASLRHGATHKLWTPLFITGFSIIFLNRLALSPVNAFLSLYVVEQLEWDAVGLMWALSSGSEIPFIFLSKRLIRRFGAMPLIAFATAAILARFAIITLFPSRTGVVFSQLTHSVCYGVFHPAAVSFIATCVKPEQRALGMSLYLALGTGVPALLGALAGGFIVERSGFRSLFLFFSIFAALALLLYFVTRKHMARLSNEN